jgi:hypothetical protein
MSTSPQRDGDPRDQEPAEGSRGTVDAALAADENDSGNDDDLTPFEEAERGVSDRGPDA